MAAGMLWGMMQDETAALGLVYLFLLCGVSVCTCCLGSRPLPLCPLSCDVVALTH